MMGGSSHVIASNVQGVNNVGRISLYTLHDPIATIGNQEISKKELDAFLYIFEEIPMGWFAVVDSPELAKELVRSLGEATAIGDLARERGLDKRDLYLAQIKTMGNLLLSDFLFEDMLRQGEISEEMLQKKYDADTAKLDQYEYLISHLIVKTLSEAEGILEDLDEGEVDFSELVKERSIEKYSVVQGNEPGWVIMSWIAPEMRSIISAMEKGQFSQVPVLIGEHYHLFYLHDFRDIARVRYVDLDEDKKRAFAKFIFEENSKHFREHLQITFPDKGE